MQQSYPPQQQPYYPPQNSMPAQHNDPKWIQQYASYADPNQLRQYFDSVDTDRSGDISVYELEAALEAAGEDFDDQEVEMMMAMFDVDQNGKLNFAEFVELKGFLGQIKNVFSQYDQDGDGALTEDQVSSAMAAIHGPQFIDTVGGKGIVDQEVVEFRDKGIPFLSHGRKNKKSKRHGKKDKNHGGKKDKNHGGKKGKKGPGIFTVRNFIILAVAFGVLRTLNNHGKLPNMQGFGGAKLLGGAAGGAGIVALLSKFGPKLLGGHGGHGGHGDQGHGHGHS